MPEHDQKKAYMFALLAVFFWSTVATAFKLTLGYLEQNTVLLVLMASVVSAAALFLVIVAQGKMKTIFTQTPREIAHSAWLGFLNPFLYYSVLFKAYSLLPAQEAQPLNMTWPILMVILAIPMLKQKVSFPSLLAFLISFAGVYVIATRGNLLSFGFSNPFGVALAVGSSLVWALYWIGNVKDKRDEVIKLFTGFAFGSIYCVISAFVFDAFTAISWQALAGAVYIGLFEMGLSFVFWLKALRYSTSTDRVAILIYAVPFISMIFISFIAGETILISSVLGAALIVSGIVFQKWIGRALLKAATFIVARF